MSEEKVTLANISADLAIEFNEALSKIMANVADENYPATRKRNISISLDFKPDSARQVIDVIPKVKIKIPDDGTLASAKVYSNISNDGTVKDGAVLHNPNQLTADMD